MAYTAKQMMEYREKLKEVKARARQSELEQMEAWNNQGKVKQFPESGMIHCPDTNERVIGYAAYLETEHWKQLKQRKIKSVGKYVCGCGRTDQVALQFHHISYANVGMENLEDIVMACRECHKLAHEIYDKHGGMLYLKEATERAFAQRRGEGNA